MNEDEEILALYEADRDAYSAYVSEMRGDQLPAFERPNEEKVRVKHLEWITTHKALRDRASAQEVRVLITKRLVAQRVKRVRQG